ncbi:hypothetical protein ACHAWF_018328 [Thalassiosira exigua]
MDELRRKIAEYGSFISQTLQPQLQAAVEAREGTEAEISEYVRLRDELRSLEEALVGSTPSSDAAGGAASAVVDLAHGAAYCRASVPNPRAAYVDVGFGFYVEMTLPEAMAFAEKRVAYLEGEVLKHRAEVAARIAKDVEGALELLEDLREEAESLEGTGRGGS